MKARRERLQGSLLARDSAGTLHARYLNQTELFVLQGPEEFSTRDYIQAPQRRGAGWCRYARGKSGEDGEGAHVILNGWLSPQVPQSM